MTSGIHILTEHIHTDFNLNFLMFSLEGKTAVVTGGGSGIGRAIAGLFAQQGAQVIVADLNEAAANELVDQIKAQGGRAIPMVSNVADQAQSASAMAGIISKVGRISILVNSAGISHIGR